MGNPQLTYSLTRTKAITGTPVYVEMQGFVASRACESASIDFGLGVGAGSSDDEVVVGAGAYPLGIAIRSNANPMDSDDDGQYVQYAQVSILDKDFCWVTTASASGSYGDTVVMNDTTGAITIGDDTPSTSTQIGWLAQTVTAAGIVKIYVDSRQGILASHAETHETGGDDTVTPIAHASAHETGGADEISLVDLTGLSATAQTPIAHAASHEDGGADEIDVTDLSGVLADEQDAGLIKGVTVDDTSIADNLILKFNSSSGNLEYEADATA